MALRNSQYDTILRTYYSRQLEHKHEKDKRVNEVYEHVPAIAEIDKSIASMSVSQAKKLLSGDTDALATLKSDIACMADKRAKLLRENGYPSDYLDMKYDCPDCKDTGYIGSKKCHCFMQAAIDLLYTQSNLKEVLAFENFKNFSYDWYPNDRIDEATGLTSYDNMHTNVMPACLDFLNTFDTMHGNLLFFGDTGVGKTFLSHCIANELIKKAYSVIYLTSIELFDTFAKYEFNRDPEVKAEDMYEHILNCDLLIIDDLGTEMNNSFTNSKLFYCINERIVNKKSTIISTNLSFQELIDRYSERIFSRLTSSYTMLKMYGDDIRIKKKTV